MADSQIPTVTLKSGDTVPALGLGTWRMGEDPARRRDEVAAIRRGIELGMSLVDTAEMYGDGSAEELVGEALSGIRDRVFLVSKAYPHNAGRDSLPAACERSLARLRTDRLDLYLLHWRGSVPLEETAAAMERLREAGKIRLWGVSNLDRDDMEELMGAGGEGCQVDQILLNLLRRGPELDLLPWLGRHRVAAMAYSPVEQGRLLASRPLAAAADRIGTSPAALALAWLLRRPGTIAIPKAGTVAHAEANRAAADLSLDDDTVAALDRAFPAPPEAVPLQML